MRRRDWLAQCRASKEQEAQQRPGAGKEQPEQEAQRPDKKTPEEEAVAAAADAVRESDPSLRLLVGLRGMLQNAELRHLQRLRLYAGPGLASLEHAQRYGWLHPVAASAVAHLRSFKVFQRAARWEAATARLMRWPILYAAYSSRGVLQARHSR